MKLELKHLAPYLPYMLKGITLRGTIFYLGISSNMLGTGIEDREISTWLKEGFKPILKRMDILSISPIIIDEMNEIHTVEYNGKGTFVEPDAENGDPFSAEYLPYSSLLILFKHHFDVFGLIDAGLAIDINAIPELLNS